MTENLPVNICIVDDDSDFVEFLGQYLVGRGLATKCFETAEALLKSGELGTFDFFLLDLGLPGIDGIDLIKLIRTRSQAGILVISGRMGPDSFNSAISAGADMFVNKPVRFDQVYNAITSVCRQVPLRANSNPAWQLAVAQSELLAPDGSMVALSQIEVRILHCLCQQSPEPVPRKDLAAAVGIEHSDTDRTLDAAVFQLRRKIEVQASQPSPIKTVHGVGYQIVKPVEVSD